MFSDRKIEKALDFKHSIGPRVYITLQRYNTVISLQIFLASREQYTCRAGLGFWNLWIHRVRNTNLLRIFNRELSYILKNWKIYLFSTRFSLWKILSKFRKCTAKIDSHLSNNIITANINKQNLSREQTLIISLRATIYATNAEK